MINLATTNIIFLSRPCSEIKIKIKKVANEDDNTSYLLFFICNTYYILYIGQVWYSLSDVNKGNTHVIIKKVNHSVEKTIINHWRVIQVTENILEVNIVKITFILSFVQSKYSQI